VTSEDVKKIAQNVTQPIFALLLPWKRGKNKTKVCKKKK
jgi:hypothetical protein